MINDQWSIILTWDSNLTEEEIKKTKYQPHLIINHVHTTNWCPFVSDGLDFLRRRRPKFFFVDAQLHEFCFGASQTTDCLLLHSQMFFQTFAHSQPWCLNLLVQQSFALFQEAMIEGRFGIQLLVNWSHVAVLMQPAAVFHRLLKGWVSFMIDVDEDYVIRCDVCDLTMHRTVPVLFYCSTIIVPYHSTPYRTTVPYHCTVPPYRTTVPYHRTVPPYRTTVLHVPLYHISC